MKGGTQVSVADIAAPTISGTVWAEMVQELPTGVVLQDEGGEVLAANERAAELLGLDREDLLAGVRPHGWLACDDSGASLPDRTELGRQVLRTGTQLTVPMVIMRDGRPASRLWATYHPAVHRGRPALLVMLQPVATDASHSTGLVDPLTGLPGRALLLDRLDQSLTRSRTMGTLTSLLLIDVHQLASVNSRYGFETGDQLLKSLARRLRDGLRADNTVARYGGDEFAVIAEHPSGTGETLAARVHELAKIPLVVNQHTLQVKFQLSWVTSDGQVGVLSMLDSAEQRLRAGAALPVQRRRR